MTEEQEVINSPEEDAAFLAEMANGDIGEVAPVSSDDSGNISTPEPEVAPIEEVEPERKEVIAGYTEQELRDALSLLPKLQKAVDTTAGTFGSRLADQGRLIEQLQKQREGVGKLTPEKLTRLSRDFPELAQLLADDLSEVMQGGVDNSQIEQVQSKVSDLERILAEKEAISERKERDRAKKDLTKAHPDWQTVAMYTPDQNGNVAWNNPQFGEWFNKQDAETRDRLINEVDADFLSEQLTSFKSSIKPRAVKKTIENAVLPAGGARQLTSSALDEEEAAFRAEMAKR